MSLTILMLPLQSKTIIKNVAELILFSFTSIHLLEEFKIDSAEIHSFYTYILIKSNTQDTFNVCIKK